MEFIGATFFFTLTMYLLLTLEKARNITFRLVTLLGVSLFLLFYIYAAGKVFAVGGMLVGLAMLCMKKAGWKRIGLLLLFCLITFGLSLSYVQDGSFFYRSDELKTQCKTEAIQCFNDNLFSHLSLLSYFGNTYRPPDFPVYTHSITGASLLPRFVLPFLLIGVFLFIGKMYRKDLFSIFIMLEAVLAIIPASLTIRGFDSYRSSALLPILFILIAFGFDAVIKYMQKASTGMRMKYTLLFFLLFTVAVAYRNIPGLFAYEYRVEAAGYSGWQYGARQILTSFTKYPGYIHYVITPSIAYDPYLYLRFYNPGNRYPKLMIGKNGDYLDSRTLYAVRPYEVINQKFTVKNTIYYPNGHDIAFYVGEYK
jgi:hypothetical protein